MKKFSQFLVAIILILIFTNCSPSFFALYPDEESSFEMGRKVMSKENESAYSTLAFEEQVDDHFIFNLFVHNKGVEDIIFDPADIYMKIYDENKELMNLDRYYALDPEWQIQNLDNNIKERKDLHGTVTGLNIVFSLFDTIVDLTDDEDNNTEEVLENIVIFTGNQVSEEIDYENDMDYLKNNRSYWKNEVLRKTELSAEEGIGGIIYIPFNRDAKYIKVYLPIGNTVHSYKFQQIEQK